MIIHPDSAGNPSPCEKQWKSEEGVWSPAKAAWMGGTPLVFWWNRCVREVGYRHPDSRCKILPGQRALNPKTNCKVGCSDFCIREILSSVGEVTKQQSK
ncbi:hypothetical protein CRENBAI_017407 [Crenichthys baileyi]|uniref:Uncharacterized protein n=1 Tax=Crenichthys baileyi TaxID=28760 RepID=A0AAV9RJ73_9TELE